MDEHAEDIRRQNIETREQLARDVRALEYRFDVKQRLGEKVQRKVRATKARMADDRPALLGVAVVGTLATVLVAFGAARRRREQRLQQERTLLRSLIDRYR